MTRVLVAFGSSHDGTAGLAEMIAAALTAVGCRASALPASDIHDLTGVDAVVVAGALYGNRWHRDARRFIKRHRERLRTLPVWVVSSGPLDDSAEHTDIPPTRQVRKLMAQVGARGHVTFGGRLAADASGFPARALAKTHAGDWRDREHVRRWAHAVADELQAVHPSPGSVGE